jgi:hypothetical protein
MISDFQGPVLDMRFSNFRYPRLSQCGRLGEIMAKWRTGMTVYW